MFIDPVDTACYDEKKLHMIGLGVYGLNREFGISQSGHATVTVRYFA